MVDMRKIAFTFIVMLLSIMLSVMGRTGANFAPAQGVYIQGPSERTYISNQTSSIPLWIEAVVPPGANPVIRLLYSVDDGENLTMPKVYSSTYYPQKEVPHNMDIYYNHDVTLRNLTDGQHIVKAYSRNTLGNEMAAQPVIFTVQSNNSTTTPNPSESAPSNPSEFQGISYVTVASVIVILAVVSVSLVYLNKRNKQMPTSLA
jgi:hypothetical protein